jgi:hypothetical protein
MLRGEAYIAERLDAQLEDNTVRFLGDRSRNRYDSANGKLEVSRIFDWYQADFERGGAGPVAQFIARYAEAIADDAASRAVVRQGRAQIRYTDYDWALNDVKR